MGIEIHAVAQESLPDDILEGWRKVPVSIAVDLGRNLGQIDPAIRPLNPPGRQPALFGRAVTVLCAPPDFGAVVTALDIAGPGDVLMIAAAGNAEFAMIGEILGGHLRRRGCGGLVCDGAVRDVATLAAWPDFSVYARFITPRGPTSAEHGAINIPVVIGGTLVSPGDIVIGDDDGLVALAPATARMRLPDANAKIAKEAMWIRSLEGGQSAKATFGLDVA